MTIIAKFAINNKVKPTSSHRSYVIGEEGTILRTVREAGEYWYAVQFLRQNEHGVIDWDKVTSEWIVETDLELA